MFNVQVNDIIKSVEVVVDVMLLNKLQEATNKQEIIVLNQKIEETICRMSVVRGTSFTTWSRNE